MLSFSGVIKRENFLAVLLAKFFMTYEILSLSLSIANARAAEWEEKTKHMIL